MDMLLFASSLGQEFPIYYPVPDQKSLNANKLRYCAIFSLGSYFLSTFCVGDDLADLLSSVSYHLDLFVVVH